MKPKKIYENNDLMLPDFLPSVKYLVKKYKVPEPLKTNDNELPVNAAAILGKSVYRNFGIIFFLKFKHLGGPEKDAGEGYGK